MIHLLSDPHFNCPRLVANTRPEFTDVKQHDEHVMDRINTKVARTDTLIITGDLCYGRPFSWRLQLRCKNVRFVLGNHDNQAQCTQAFGRVDKYLTLRTHGQKIVVCHYPFAFWEGSHKGWFHAYGHVHARYEEWLDRAFPGRRSQDVGVDLAKKLLGDYEPFSADEFMGFLAARPGHEQIPDDEKWAEKDYDSKP